METLQNGGVSSRALADQYGTPLYAYDENKIKRKTKAAAKNFASNKFDAKLAFTRRKK